MLVSFFARQTLISRSLSFECSPDDHARVDALARIDEEHTAVLELEHRVGIRLPLLDAYQDALHAVADRTPVGLVVVKGVVEDGLTLRLVQQLRPDADQTPRRAPELEAHVALPGLHAHELAAALARGTR